LPNLKEEEKNSLSEIFCVKGEMDNTGGESSTSEVLSQTSQLVLSGLGSLPTIKKLVGRNNYSKWKFGMEMFLAAEDLWDVVTCNETNVKKDARVKSKICLMVDEPLYFIMKSSKTAEEVWKKLEQT
jgi:hypothetical protein